MDNVKNYTKNPSLVPPASSEVQVSSYGTGASASSNHIMGSWTSSTLSPTPNKGKRQIAEELEEVEKSLQDSVDSIKETKKILNELKFDKGDIVHHKILGACIVVSITVLESYSSPSNSHFPVTILAKVAHEEGVDSVDVSELIPRSEFTKALYE